jgi:hypothetical protein
MSWLAEHHPHLVRRYERMYAYGAYAPKWYQRRVTRQVHGFAEAAGIGPSGRGVARRIPEPERLLETAEAAPKQLTLL